MAAHIKPSTHKLSPLLRLSLILKLLEKARKDGERRSAVVLRSLWVGVVC